MKEKAHILIIEDEKNISDILKLNENKKTVPNSKQSFLLLFIF